MSAEQMASGGWALLYACSKRQVLTSGSPQRDHCFPTQFLSVPAGGITMLEGEAQIESTQAALVEEHRERS